MKICLFLQRRFVYVGHEIAAHLNQKYGVQEFCAYIQVRRGFNFIKSQASPRFTQVLLDEDIHNRYKNEKIDWDYIKGLEQNYGLPNLWFYVETDRIVRSGQLVRAYPYDTPPYSHEEMAKIIQVKAKAIIKFFDEEKPDVIIFSVVGSIDSLLLWQIAKKKNIKTLQIHNTRVGIKQTISENYSNFSYVNDLFNKLQVGAISLPEDEALANDFLKKFRQQPVPYSTLDSPKNCSIGRRRQLGFLKPKKLIWSIYWRSSMIVRYFINPYRHDYSNINPFIQIWDNLKKKTRVLIGYDDLCDDIVSGEDYAYFPLHMEPEIATLLYAPFYKDQLWLIKQLARSLPMNFKLYLKEHPTMHGNRLRRFYKELKKIPNVKLIRPTVEGLPLISRAKLIVTISGTAGWEAAQLKKPVITFSDVFYGQLPMVKKCTTIEQLPYLVKEQLENFKPDETALINFLTAIFHESVDVDLMKIWDVEGGGQVKAKREQLWPLADLIAEKLNLEPKN